MYLVIGRKDCPYCELTKELLTKNSDEFVYKDLSLIDETEAALLKSLVKEELSMKTVPVVLKLIGGYVELSQYVRTGE